MTSRLELAEWLEWSGLPTEMNAKVRGAWPIFKKIVELDCRMNRRPDAVEVSLGELSERCGVEWEKIAKTLESLQKKKYLACFLPDNPDEPGLFQIRTPIATPRSPEAVAAATHDPHLKDPTHFRYARATEEEKPDEAKVQKIVDLYLNTLSQKINSFIVGEIEVVAQRFEFEEIEKAIHRAAKHEIRSMGWVAKELIRDRARKKKSEKSEV